MSIHFDYGFGNILGLIFCLATAMVGHTIHGSVPWAIVDFLLAPFAWCKWLLYKEVNVTIIKKSFADFLK